MQIIFSSVGKAAIYKSLIFVACKIYYDDTDHFFAESKL